MSTEAFHQVGICKGEKCGAEISHQSQGPTLTLLKSASWDFFLSLVGAPHTQVPMLIRILLHLLPASSSSITFHHLLSAPSALVSWALFLSPKPHCFALEHTKLISELHQARAVPSPQQYLLSPMTCLWHLGVTQLPHCLPLQEPSGCRRRLEQAKLQRSYLDFVAAEHLQGLRQGCGYLS